MHARTEPSAFVAFVTSQYLPDASKHTAATARTACAPFVCTLVQWTRQVHRVASSVQAQAGEPAEVGLRRVVEHCHTDGPFDGACNESLMGSN